MNSNMRSQIVSALCYAFNVDKFQDIIATPEEIAKVFEKFMEEKKVYIPYSL